MQVTVTFYGLPLISIFFYYFVIWIPYKNFIHIVRSYKILFSFMIQEVNNLFGKSYHHIYG